MGDGGRRGESRGRAMGRGRGVSAHQTWEPTQFGDVEAGARLGWGLRTSCLPRTMS